MGAERSDGLPISEVNHEGHKGHEGTISASFVAFVSFVVKFVLVVRFARPTSLTLGPHPNPPPRFAQEREHD